MISSQTWPNFYGGSAQEGVQLLLAERNLVVGSDVEYGRTKLFIRHPRTLLELENERSKMIPALCLLLQRVWNVRLCFSYSFFEFTLFCSRLRFVS